MRTTTIIITLLLHAAARAGDFTLQLDAPGHPGKAVALYRYDDLFTMRTVRVATAPVGDDGRAVLTADVEGTTKLQVRIGDVTADLFARPGGTLHARFLPPAPGTPRSLNGTTRTSLELYDLPHTDINALTTDLNERLDTFISEDLATDQARGMQALDIVRKDSTRTAPDGTQRPPTLFVMPSWSYARVDTFERKLRRFYGEVDDPWFSHYLTSSIAGLQIGPRTNDRILFDRYLSNTAVRYDDPEFVRFFRSFHSEQLGHVLRFHGAGARHALATADADSLRRLFATNDFLKDDPMAAELAMIDALYLHYNEKRVDQAQSVEVLRKVAGSSASQEHRRIATNMLWDLLTMRPGQPLPVIRTTDPAGKPVDLNTLLEGPVCIAFTAAWCTYCDLEMAGLQQLHKEYKDAVRFIAIGLDSTLQAMNAYRKAHPAQEFIWLHAEAGQQLREDLRLRTLPAFLLLNGNVLAHSPAPMPGSGLGPLLHQAKAAQTKDQRIKVWDD